tara:strand:+ start:53 stop:1057 length:1005 start_codon:yes stop_codon:yes gene_type:complete
MKIYFANSPTKVGGPSTFIRNLKNGLEKRNYKIAFDQDKKNISTVIVTSSTKKIAFLILCKIKGIKIIQRLDGMWYQSLSQSGNIIKYIYFKLVNFIMFLIRNFVADIVIYQSEFVKNWWEKKYGVLSKKSIVIYNGAKLKKWVSSDEHLSNEDQQSRDLICVEGNFHNNDFTLNLLNEVSLRCKNIGIKKLHLFGNISQKMEKKLNLNENIVIHGHQNKKIIDKYIIDKPIHLSLDVNSACPNSVIESMCSGIPIVGLNTGSLKELVGDNAGIVVDYIGDHFAQNIDPNFEDIVEAIMRISNNYLYYSENSYKRAKAYLTVDQMVENYSKHLT